MRPDHWLYLCLLAKIAHQIDRFPVQLNELLFVKLRRFGLFVCLILLIITAVLVELCKQLLVRRSVQAWVGISVILHHLRHETGDLFEFLSVC